MGSWSVGLSAAAEPATAWNHPALWICPHPLPSSVQPSPRLLGEPSPARPTALGPASPWMDWSGSDHCSLQLVPPEVTGCSGGLQAGGFSLLCLLATDCDLTGLWLPEPGVS